MKTGAGCAGAYGWVGGLRRAVVEWRLERVVAWGSALWGWRRLAVCSAGPRAERRGVGRRG